MSLTSATYWRGVRSARRGPCGPADAAEGSGWFPRTDATAPAVGVPAEDRPPAFLVRGAISNSHVGAELPDLAGRERAPEWVVLPRDRPGPAGGRRGRGALPGVKAGVDSQTKASPS